MNTERLATVADLLASRVASRMEAAARTIRGYGARVHDARTANRADKVLVLGGARSGKSHHAERLVSCYEEVTYVAGGPPPSDDDPEWAARVTAHQARRPAHWHTVESPDLAQTLRGATTPLLIDCLGTWLSRVLDELGAWQQQPGWQERVDERLADVVDAYTHATVPVVAVSNEVGNGVVPATTAGRTFRDVLGSLNSRISTRSDSALLVVAGRIIALEDSGKGVLHDNDR